MDWSMAAVQLVMMAATSVISAVAGWFGARYKASKAKAESNQAEHAAMKKACMLYAGQRLDELCMAYKASETHTAAETQAIISAWETYHGCGGDGVRAALVERTIGIKVEE